MEEKIVGEYARMKGCSIYKVYQAIQREELTVSMGKQRIRKEYRIIIDKKSKNWIPFVTDRPKKNMIIVKYSPAWHYRNDIMGKECSKALTW